MSSLLALASMAATAGLWACLAASLRHFRGAPTRPPRRPMTLIKPVRGLDEAMQRSFESIVAADPLRCLQIIVAIETEQDPAWPVAQAFAAAHPERDIRVLRTGPAGALMGKAHNMIEALKAAKHPVVIFSDADVCITPPLLADTAAAFDAGAGAAYGLPYHADAPGFAGWCFMLAFNHAYCVAPAASALVGQFRFFAGAWMAYTKEALSLIGGLERCGHSIADDYALGEAARRAGVKQKLLREPVFVDDSDREAAAALRHLAKWASIVAWSFPPGYLLAPLLNPVVLGAAAALAGAGPLPLAAALASRCLVGLLQDRLVGGLRRPAWTYLSLAFADAAAVLIWPFGLRRVVSWRGRRYRLSLGGRCEVLPS